MKIKEKVRHIISEVCTHWICVDDNELEKVSAYLAVGIQKLIDEDGNKKTNWLIKHRKSGIVREFNDIVLDELIDNIMKLPDSDLASYMVCEQVLE